MTIKISQLGNLTVAADTTSIPVIDYVANTLTTLQANVTTLRTYFTSNVYTALVANIANVNASITLANTNMLGYVNGQILAANAGVVTANISMHGYVDNTVSTNVAILNVSITASNVGMKGYVDNTNVAIKGYIDQGNTIQSAQINSANVGMKGYVDAVTTAWTANAYQQQALIGNLQVSAYSNVNVAAYLPSYNNNTGNINVNTFLTVGLNNNGGSIYIGNSAVTFGNVVVNGVGLANSYVQLNIQNIDSVGKLNSADFIATAPDGTDGSKYIDMGINGNNWSSSSWTVSGADDGYLYVNTGNLTVGTDTPGTTVKVHVGGTLAGNVVTTFNSSNVAINGNLILGNTYVPSANNSIGTPGQIAWSSGYVYICVAPNSWRRANLAIW